MGNREKRNNYNDLYLIDSTGKKSARRRSKETRLEVSHFELWVPPILCAVGMSLGLVDHIQHTSHWILAAMIDLRHVTFLMQLSMPDDTHDAH